MAPRRTVNSGVGSNHLDPLLVDQMHNLLNLSDVIGGDPFADQNSAASSPTSSSHNSSGSSNSNLFNPIGSSMFLDKNNNKIQCCVPIGECLNANSFEFGLINLEDLRECVRVVCNNEQCSVGQYMHRECFEAWEQTVLSYLKSTGRARSWSDKQRQQNLWTKKGYDLIFKICTCKCGRGHLKKDLDWQPPSMDEVDGNNNSSAINNKNNGGKKKKNRKNQKPILSISTLNQTGYHQNFPILQQKDDFRIRANSVISSSSSIDEVDSNSSPPISGLSSDLSISPVLINTINGVQNLSLTSTNNYQQQNNGAVAKKQKSKVELYSDRIRAGSGCNGIFSRRLDFSSFNVLPTTRLNSYQIKMEDEGNHGNDETRLFILSSLASQQKSRVACILCEESMLVFDRYPLVDGTFFLSPKRHSHGCVEVKYEGRVQYLTSVCMSCLEGVSPERVIRCRFCGQNWDGSSLVLGTMYSYDIFAAMPCCTERLKCNNCFKLLLHPNQRLNFYSDYSHGVTCTFCATQDTHFVKPIGYCYTKQPLQMFQQWP